MERGGEALRERAGREEVSPAPDSEVRSTFPASRGAEPHISLPHRKQDFLQQEVVHRNTNGNSAPQEVTSYMNMKTKRTIR